MRKSIFIFSVIILAACVMSSCSNPAPAEKNESTSARKGSPDLLAAVLFYPGYACGSRSHATGLQKMDAATGDWNPLAWHELKVFSLHARPDGKWIYLAAGNGVLYSRDAGLSWRLTGGWRVNEVLDVVSDPEDPRVVWAATAYGVYFTGDINGRNDSWKESDSGGRFRFTSDVYLHADGRLFAATERGIFVSNNRGVSFKPVKTGVVGRRIVADRSDSSRLLCATDGQGIYESRDNGSTWKNVTEKPGYALCLEQHPEKENVWYCGSTEGVHVSADGGATWRPLGEGLEDGCYIYDMAVDPADGDCIIACGNYGIFRSTDSGQTWKRYGLDGAMVGDVEFQNLAAVEEKVVRKDETDGMPPMGKTPHEYRGEPFLDFENNRKKAIEYLKGKYSSREKWKFSFFPAILEVKEGAAPEGFWDAVRKELGNPGHSMFYCLPLTAFYHHLKDVMPDDVKDTIRRILTGVTMYRGDTENHWALHYAALLLAAETWPDTKPEEWYTGNTSVENYEEAKSWFVHWARLTARKGQGEFDSPHYIYMYVVPMLLLYDFAKDREVRQLAGMALDLLLADYFVESLEGSYCGGHSRTMDKSVQKGSQERVAFLHYLYAGGIPMPESIHSWNTAALYSTYRAPAEFTNIANKRNDPYVHTELKRVRNVIRYGDELNPPVYKYDYMTPLYCLGSLQGGILQPIQQHTWDVTWKSEAKNPTFFTLHPYCSDFEMGMFFPEDVHQLVRAVTAAKPSYSSPDKWVSSSPYEKVFQRKNVLLVLYNAPEADMHPHVNMYFPDCLEKTEQGGWLFGRDGEFYLACYPCRKGEWKKFDDHSRMRATAVGSGFVVVTRPVENADGKTFEEFKKQILAAGAPELKGKSDSLSLTYKHSDGRVFVLNWKDKWGRINGKEIEFPADRIFDGPFMRGNAGTGVVTITAGGVERILDFNVFDIEVRKNGE